MKLTSNALNRWLLFSAALLIAGAVWIYFSRADPARAQSRPPAPQTGFSAPDFGLSTLESSIIRLSDLRGRPVIINLWASWCPPCRAEMPALQNVYADYQDQGLVVLAVNATNQDQLQAAAAFSQEMGLTFPILLDLDGTVSRLYRLQSLPTTYFVGADGVIRDVVIGGPMSEALLRVRTEQLLEAKDTP